MKTFIRTMKACGDDNRLRILKMLQHREMCVCELTEALRITQPSVSRHLKILEDADLVTHRREGQWINYRLNWQSENPYARKLLNLMKQWLEDDPDIQALLLQAARIDRELICGRGTDPHKSTPREPDSVAAYRGNKNPLRVLFLCTGNSCRSQMAEGWARDWLGDRVNAYSAGTDPTVVNPLAIQVMKEVGVDISSHRSKSLDDLVDPVFDLVVTLCDDAQAGCPVFPGRGKMVHMGFPDPAKAIGTEGEVLQVFREVRDRIRDELIPVLEEEISNITATETGVEDGF
jgi:arsenate reductase